VKAITIMVAVAVAVLLSCAAGATAAPAPGAPQLYNGDFEVQGPQRADTRIPAGYTVGGLGSMDRVASGTDGVPAYSGLWAVRLTVPPGYAAAQIYNPRPFPVAPGAYTLRVALRSEGYQARAIVGYAYLNASRVPITGAWGEAVITPAPGSWSVHTLPANAPVEAAYVVVSVRNSMLPGPHATSNLYVDALDFVPTSPMPSGAAAKR
jgi:hypothetical protein